MQRFAWQMLSRASGWLALALCLLACGCPQRDKLATGETGAAAQPAAVKPSTTAQADPATKLNPTLPIPADEPLAEYAGLKLGMNSVELAQVYPAPEGRGETYSRVIEDYGDVQHHIIAFDVREGEPERRIVASLYRDQLYLIIDRRDGVNAAQLEAWRSECFAKYGKACTETINGAQWTWKGKDSVSLTFTQDNSAPDYQDAHVIVAHQPTQDSAHAYLELREAHEESTTRPAGSTTR
jgi:hypothetical protein